MARTPVIDLPNGLSLPILYEDRSVLAIDKPAGWLLAPDSWDKTGRNLQLALRSSMAAGDFWARSRNLKFLRHVHRLDAETTGILLLAKSQGALQALSALFEARQVGKTYWAVTQGTSGQAQWSCRLKLEVRPEEPGKWRGSTRHGKPAETHFRRLEIRNGRTLVEACPVTGRTHQIRVHLAATGHPVCGDALYGKSENSAKDRASGMALRAVELAYRDPFLRKQVRIQAPTAEFLETFGFGP